MDHEKATLVGTKCRYTTYLGTGSSDLRKIALTNFFYNFEMYSFNTHSRKYTKNLHSLIFETTELKFLKLIWNVGFHSVSFTVYRKTRTKILSLKIATKYMFMTSKSIKTYFHVIY